MMQEGVKPREKVKNTGILESDYVTFIRSFSFVDGKANVI